MTLPRRTNIRMTSAFSSKAEANIFKETEEINHQSRILYPMKIYFKNDAKVKT